MISSTIKALRANMGLSQAALAKKLGVTRASVNAWEMEISSPTAQYLVEMARLFHTSTDFILGLESEEKIVLREMTEEEKAKALVKLEKMQDFLYDYMEDQIMDTQEETIEMPKLFYTTTPAGNICLLNDLKEIPRENYDDFLTLFDSVHMGKLRRIKTIDRSGKKFQNSFCQVRLNYARMTLHIMKNNCIVLSSAFLKHAQRSSIFSNRFKSIDANYSRQKDYIEKHIEDPQFIEKQEQVTSQVYKLLRKER